MRQFAAFLRVSIKSVFTPYSVFAVLILAFSLAIGSYIEKELLLRADIGVLHENTSISEEIIENLRLFSNVNVIEYDNEEALCGDVASRKIECGYVFDAEVDKYIQNGTINKGVTLYKSPATVADGFTNELVYAALLKTAAPYISANYLKMREGGDYKTILSDAKSGIEAYYDDGVFLDVQIIPVNGGDMPEAPKENSINAGIVSVFIFIMFFHLAIRAMEEKTRGLFEKLPKKESLVYLASFFGAHSFYIFVASLIFLFFTSGSVPRVFLALAVYCSVLAVLFFWLASFLKSAHGLYALLPVISAAVITLGGAFFDLGEIMPALSGVSRLFPTYYFVRFIQ